MTLGENIRKKRLEYDIEQQELAKRIGVSKMTISYYESGMRVPTVANLVSIADALHCSIDELLGRKAG